MKKRLYQALLGLVLSASVAAGGFFAAVPQTAYAQNVATDLESGYHLADNVQDGVILHCFDWTYQQIIDELPDIRKSRIFIGTVISGAAGREGKQYLVLSVPAELFCCGRFRTGIGGRSEETLYRGGQIRN